MWIKKFFGLDKEEEPKEDSRIITRRKFFLLGAGAVGAAVVVPELVKEIPLALQEQLVGPNPQTLHDNPIFPVDTFQWQAQQATAAICVTGMYYDSGDMYAPMFSDGAIEYRPDGTIWTYVKIGRW